MLLYCSEKIISQITLPLITPSLPIRCISLKAKVLPGPTSFPYCLPPLHILISLAALTHHCWLAAPAQMPVPL